MDTQDFYVELGVPKAATQDEIRQAFKALARRYHPDRNPDDIPSQEKFQRINSKFRFYILRISHPTDCTHIHANGLCNVFQYHGT